MRAVCQGVMSGSVAHQAEPDTCARRRLTLFSVKPFQDDRAQLGDTRSVDDWRLMGQETFLQGAQLILQTWRPYRSGWDHDHCEFCSRHISVPLAVDDEDAVGRGYATPDGYHWICEPCFADFQAQFDWTVA